MPTHDDYLFRGDLAELDPDVAELIRHETARQERTLILIPSESTVPNAVREALSSAFHNIYAEGYPLDETRTMTQAEILDYNARLPEYRRYADKRYYKGTEYADVIEALARRRAAELFATPEYPAEKLFVNVQPLSGAPANSAIFSGLINVGDTIMGLDLLQGGHLTHGSPVARSGKQYNAVSYSVDPETELLDYDAIRALALEHKPKIIIAGYTSYPYAPDWEQFRDIAHEVGAYLMADIAHVAGLVIAGVYPVAGRHRRRGQLHDSQDAGGSARRGDHHPSQRCRHQGRSRRLPRRAGRSARPRDRGAGGLAAPRLHGAVQRTSAADRPQRDPAWRSGSKRAGFASLTAAPARTCC